MSDQWSTMTPDILGSISDRLPLADFLAFRGVCGSWRSAPSGRSDIFKFDKDKDWLMFYDVGDRGDECYVYSASQPTCCTFRLPGLEGATIVESKLGWFLAHRNDGDLFFHNPFSLEKIEFARHPLASDAACTFSRPPTCPRCVVYVMRRWDDVTFRVSRRRMKDAEWRWRNIKVKDRDAVQGNILDIYSLCCCVANDDDGGDSCTCDYKNKIVFTLKLGSSPASTLIYGYDFDARTCTGGMRREGGDESDDDICGDNPFGELRARHGDDWSKRIGKRRVWVAPLSRCRSSEHSGGIFPRTRGIGMNEEKRRTAGGGETAKAVWVEPLLALYRLRKASAAF